MSAQPTTPDPWERQPDEPPRAFQGFATYRDMGYDRSLTKVGRALHKSTAVIATWSRRHAWVERVAAWDAYVDEESRRADLARWTAARGRHMAVLESLGNLVEARLKGSPEVEAIDPDFGWRTLHDLTDLVIRHERLTFGQATERQESSSVPATVQVNVVQEVAQDPRALEAAMAFLDRVGELQEVEVRPVLEITSAND